MKRIKQISTVFMALLLVGMSVFISYADTIYTVNGYSYTLIQPGLASLVGWDNSSYTLSVPKKIGNVYVSEIGDSAFKDDNYIKTLDFSAAERMTRIGMYAFADSVIEGNLIIPGKVTNIGVSAFEGCTNLDTVSLSSKGAVVPSQCLMDCSSLKYVTLAANIESIEQYAFKNCSSLRSIEIPYSVTSINPTAFDGCGDFIILCTSNSYAHQYAQANNIKCITTDEHFMGDVNGDGKVNIRDVTYIQLYRVCSYELKDYIAEYLADVDQNGEVNIRDATTIQLYLVGKINIFWP